MAKCKLKPVEIPQKHTKITLKGFCSNSRLYIAGFGKYGIKQKEIPEYFTIEIDISTIKPRAKEVKK